MLALISPLISVYLAIIKALSIKRNVLFVVARPFGGFGALPVISALPVSYTHLVIQRFINRGENPDDLFQVGCIGLIKAVDNFDLSQNVRFSTYAVPMIIGEVRRYMRDNNSIRVSRSLRDVAYKALQTRDHLAAEAGREPTVNQIAKAMDLPVEEVVFALDAIADPVSLFEPIYNDGGDPIFVMDERSGAAMYPETFGSVLPCKRNLLLTYSIQISMTSICMDERV